MTIQSFTQKSVQPTFHHAAKGSISNLLRHLLLGTVVSVTAIAATSLHANDNLPNGKPFQQLQSEVDELHSELDAAVMSLQQQIDKANGLIDELTIATGDNAQDIDSLQGYVDLLQKQLDLLQGNLSQDCGSGYFIQEIKADGTPVCAKDMGNGYRTITEEVMAPGIPYYPYGLNCPGSHPHIISGGYIETLTTSIVASFPKIADAGQADSQLFLLNGLGAIVLTATCSSS